MKASIIAYLLVAAVATTGMALADGKSVYDANCAMCHKMMKPKTGDKVAWASLIPLGVDKLTETTIKGKGMMPAKGGKPNLTDAEIKAAVQYMVDTSK